MLLADHAFVERGPKCPSNNDNGPAQKWVDANSFMSLNNQSISWTKCLPYGGSGTTHLSFRAAYDRVNYNYPPEGAVLNFAREVQTLGDALVTTVKPASSSHVTHGEPTRIQASLSLSGLIGQVTINFARGAPARGNRALKTLTIKIVTRNPVSRQTSTLTFYK